MFKANFRAKVLVPVIVVMALLVTVSMGLVNRRVTEQIRANAADLLMTAEAVLKITQQNRAGELVLRYRNVVAEPRIKAWATSEFFNSGGGELNSDRLKTLQNFLQYLVQEGLCDAVVLTSGHSRPLAVARDPQFDTQAFALNCSNSIERALQNQSAVETVQNRGRLFDVVTIPISVEDTNSIMGAITFGVENTLAQEFAKLTQTELAFFADSRVVASTFRNRGTDGVLPGQFGQMTARDPGENGTVETELGDEHFLCRAGWLGTPDDPHRLGYLVLSSYEKPLQELRATQQTFLLIGLLAVLSGAAVVWLLVNRITRPLRELRDGAEAVGRGDLSRRVPVRSGDECGELAVTFNRMTENVQQSRAQLEQTVATLKNTQEQLVQSEKLSAVGEFVAGVAHELNNPLTVVMGCSEMLRAAEADAKYSRQLELIFKSAQRCQKIVQSLLSFARRHQAERKPASLNSLVEAVLEIVAYPLRTGNIEVKLQLAPNLSPVLADEHQIQQVLLNIINNARQAIEAHQPSGRITIATESRGPNVRLTIQDNGPGIPEENLRRIFDPFFTTKEVGKGTGLGLSLCYGIVKEHGGSITPMSRRGEGATFIIELPIALGVPGAPATSRPAASSRLDPNEGAGKKILVIDDEEPILQMVHQVLTGHGYHVRTAADGAAALRELEANHCDAVLCDWKMPGLNGRQVYEQLRVINPGLSQRVIFITGDVINEPMQRFLESENRPCLTKPFALAELRNALKTALATR